MQQPDIKSRFGLAIRARRWQLDLTQEELAERADLNRTYITDIERGTRNVSLESVEKLAAALSLSVESLFSAGRSGGSRPRVARMPSCPDLEGQVVEILMVEDNPRDVELTLKAFKRAKIANHVCVARDGPEALELLLGAPGNKAPLPVLPHLILLDLNLPKLDGLDVLRRIKRSPRTRHIPVIVLTVSEQNNDVEKCRELGAADYIVKPVDFYSFSRVTPHLDLTWALLKPVNASALATAPPTLGCIRGTK